MRLTDNDRKRIEAIRERKQRTVDKVKSVLSDIVRDNPDVFKKPVESRTKTLDSIVRKMRTVADCTVANLERRVKDIAGARVTCCTTDEIGAAVELIENHSDVISCKDARAWNDPPDEYGYRAHHLVVKVRSTFKNRPITDTCEVQIRTLAMDLWAVLSRRDFYAAPTEPPQGVRSDMVTLSRLIAVVDDLALSLKRRVRQETDRVVSDKARTLKLGTKDMLTLENVQRLADLRFRKTISVDEAYAFIHYALSNHVTSLKQYRRLLAAPQVQKDFLDSFRRAGVEPPVYDQLVVPIFMSFDPKHAAAILDNRLQQLKEEQGVQEVEKGKAVGPAKPASAPSAPPPRRSPRQ